MLRACIFPVNRGARAVPMLLLEVRNFSLDIEAFVDESARMARQGDFVDEISVGPARRRLASGIGLWPFCQIRIDQSTQASRWLHRGDLPGQRFRRRNPHDCRWFSVARHSANNPKLSVPTMTFLKVVLTGS